ncbi:MAG: hypothetical protein N3B14_08550 [Thermoleophilia bacterium]|nr:hypothetical protein [Thermoleophilia bacterium]
MNRIRRVAFPALAALFCMIALFALGGCTQSESSAATSTSATYWQTCRRGEINDPYPGKCRDYTDANGDQICDWSQAPDSSSLGDYYTLGPDRGCPLGLCAICGICRSS